MSEQLIFRGGYHGFNMVTDKKEAKMIPSQTATALLSRDYKGQSNNTTNLVVEARIITQGHLGEGKTQSRTVYSPNGVSPTLTATMGEKGNTMPYVTVEVEESIGRR